MNYTQWAAAYPEAAHALEAVLAPGRYDPSPEDLEKSESWAQQQARFDIQRQGGYSWRNNVGATPAKCHACGAPPSLYATAWLTTRPG